METDPSCYYVLDDIKFPCPSNCTSELKSQFVKQIVGQLWRVEAVMIVNAILGGVIVGIGAYGHRYRHYGFTRYLLLGATTLFLPITSYVLSATGSTGGEFTVNIDRTLTAECTENIFHRNMVTVSACLVLISAINTSSIVAADDREDRSIRPPLELLVKGVWMVYLAVSTGAFPLHFETPVISCLRFTPFAIIHAKMALKCYAFLMAQKSYATGRNPRLIVGYMLQLRERSDQHGKSLTGEEDAPPPLVVMGEDEGQVKKQPHGYMFKNLEAIHDGSLVTIDKVWQLDNMFLIPVAQLMKDTCLSFALFKLLRCRFARYKLIDVISTETLKFVRSVLLKDGQHERAFKMIADELSFLHDYYDSPLPISYSDSWLTIFSMVVSLLSIGYCILCGTDVIAVVYLAAHSKMYFPDPRLALDPENLKAVRCFYYCPGEFFYDERKEESFGSLYFDLVPVLLLLMFVVVAEAKDIAYHICSSWTKVILTCRCVHRASLKLSPIVPKWVGLLLRCRCNRLLKHWNDKMRQTSLLVLHPRQFLQLVFPGCLLRLLDLNMSNNVKVPTAVKACIMDALRSTSNGGLSKGITSLSQDGESLLWACNNSKGTSDTILVWHIATTILEARHPHHQHDDLPRQTPEVGRPSSVSVSYKKIAATHLSRYCAYLVASCPELLPDDDAWSKDLYNEVKKDAERALSADGGTGVSSMPPEAGYRRLIELLGAAQNHEVLKDAAKLAEQLGKLTRGEEMAWELLAGFWSELILYVAPSDNIKGHLQAIDRGGELITLLWALLTHVGIVDRPDDAAAGAASAPATSV